MKAFLSLAVYAALSLLPGSANAASVDFSLHEKSHGYSSTYGNDNHSKYSKDEVSDFSWDEDKYKNNDKKYGKDSDWGGGDKEKDKKNYSSFPSGRQSFSDHNDGDEYNKHEWKKDDVPAPICATADIGYKRDHDTRHGKEGDWDDGKFGHRYKKYYSSICDDDKDHKWKHHRGDCDPGDPGNPAPLPDALPMFGAGLITLVSYSIFKKRSNALRAK